jgi:lipoprotein-anchoring transpeptidase ErfK/SrfK
MAPPQSLQETIDHHDENKGKFIIISKEKMVLTLYDNQKKAIATYPISCGKFYGNKRKSGDNKTPEGAFYVIQTQRVDQHGLKWGHDFKDGKGWIDNAYGPYFIRLHTPPHKSIGIHGTHDPASMGKRASEGCIRLKNEDIEKLFVHIYIGMPVFIMASEQDVIADIDIYKSSAESLLGQQ